MTRFQIGKYIVEADVERTRAFYESEPPMDGGCGSPSCRNYDLWSRTAVPEAVRAWFGALGVDLNKPAAADYPIPSGGTALYTGVYHVCGAVASELGFKGTPFFALADGFEVRPTSDVIPWRSASPSPAFSSTLALPCPGCWTSPSNDGAAIGF